MPINQPVLKGHLKSKLYCTWNISEVVVHFAGCCSKLEEDDGYIRGALICWPWESSMLCAFRASLFKSGSHWKGRMGNNVSKATAASLVLVLLVSYSSLHDYKCKSTKPVTSRISGGGWSVVCNLSVCDLPGVRGTGLTAAEGREKLVMLFKCSLTCQMQGAADSLLLLPSSETCGSHSTCHPFVCSTAAWAGVGLKVCFFHIILVEVKNENVHLEMELNNFLVCF